MNKYLTFNVKKIKNITKKIKKIRIKHLNIWFYIIYNIKKKFEYKLYINKIKKYKKYQQLKVKNKR